MTTTEATLAGVAAVVVFWIVGAYNRLVRLRSAIVRLFVPVDEQFRQRHALLLALLDTLAPLLTNAGPRIEALRAACGQVEDPVRAGVPGRGDVRVPAEGDRHRAPAHGLDRGRDLEPALVQGHGDDELVREGEELQEVAAFTM